MKKKITALLIALLLMLAVTTTVSAEAQSNAPKEQQVAQMTDAPPSGNVQWLAVSAAATLGVLVLAGSLVIVLNKKESHSVQASQKTKKQTDKAEVKK